MIVMLNMLHVSIFNISKSTECSDDMCDSCKYVVFDMCNSYDICNNYL